MDIQRSKRRRATNAYLFAVLAIGWAAMAWVQFDVMVGVVPVVYVWLFGTVVTAGAAVAEWRRAGRSGNRGEANSSQTCD